MNTRNHHLHQAGNSQLTLFPEAKQENQSLETLYQYFFIITPPDVVKSKVKLLRHKLNTSVALSNYNLHSIPHISLMSFHTTRPVNDKFIQAVQQLFSENRSFQVKLSGFDAFHHGTASNSIYMNIQGSEQIKRLYCELSQLLGFRIRSFVPHLTIARTVARSSFEKSLSIVNQNSFEAEFACRQVTILERKLQNGMVGDYQTLKEIYLND